MFKVNMTLMCILLFVGCGNNKVNDPGSDYQKINNVINALPKIGSNDRFSSVEAMELCDDELAIIAKYLAISFSNTDLCNNLNNQLKSRDAYGEISLNEMLLMQDTNNEYHYDVLVKKGLKDILYFLEKYPDLRLSLPSKSDKKFNAYKEFIVLVSPVIDERFVTECVAFNQYGELLLLNIDNEIPTQTLVLEIDENPYNHPKTINEDFIELPIKIGKSTSITNLRIQLKDVYLKNKLEGSWNRAEFNVTVTVGTWNDIPSSTKKHYTFPTEADRGFGITGVNWREKWYNNVKKRIYYVDELTTPWVLGICFWEDDAGGESKYEYYSADNRYLGSYCDNYYEPGYLDSHSSCPDDLYGYIHIDSEWYGDHMIPLDGAQHRIYFYGYNSSYGGNEAYNCEDPSQAKYNAKADIRLVWDE